MNPKDFNNMITVANENMYGIVLQTSKIKPASVKKEIQEHAKALCNVLNQMKNHCMIEMLDLNDYAPTDHPKLIHLKQNPNEIHYMMKSDFGYLIGYSNPDKSVQAIIPKVPQDTKTIKI